VIHALADAGPANAIKPEKRRQLAVIFSQPLLLSVGSTGTKLTVGVQQLSNKRVARPGGNVTGMSLMAPNLGAKRLELLKELLPRLTRVAVLWNAANPYSALVFQETQAGGRTLGIEVQSLDVGGPEDFDATFEAARRLHPDALITVEDPLTASYRKRIADFAVGQQLPSLHGIREFVAAGGLISYGANLADLSRRAAYYVDKIFKGAKPADLPVQQPTKFEMVINLTTAKVLGLPIPPTLIARADEVIE
jgi:putative tryptophan/tyrosine transport system substrate-binding protein